MIQFSYSFCMALLHSFWQAALLMLLYIIVDKIIHRNNAPLAKRNFLYLSIAAQLILFVFTFSVYFFGAPGIGNIAGIVQNMTAYMGADSLQIITPWIFSLYTFVIAYKLIKAIYTWFHFKNQYKSGLQKPTVELKLFTELKAHQFGIKRKVKLWLSSSIHTPITFGFFKPIILLPVTLLNNITVQQAETLILHELTHIRTNDYLLNWFLMVAETIFFFNPFVTGLCKKIRLEREKNCDMGVIAFEYTPALYAETLLQAERMKQLVPNFQLAAVSRKKHLLQRIQFFTNDKIVEQPLRFNIVAPLIGLVLLFLLSSAILFQAGNTGFPSNTSTALPYLPVNNYMADDLDFGKSAMPVTVKDENKTGIIENTQMVAETPIIKDQSLSKEPEPKEDIVIQPMAAADFAMPVAIQENDAARQIIIKEEGSGSASVKTYYLVYENGKWILQPEWIITAKEIILDSLSLKIDSLTKKIRKPYPSQQ
jgi:beta-lactamase regulating signal transducer with metallopeptidase domain